MKDGNIAAANKLKAEIFAESLGKCNQINYKPNDDLHTETESRNCLNAHKVVYQPLEQNNAGNWG